MPGRVQRVQGRRVPGRDRQGGTKRGCWGGRVPEMEQGGHQGGLGREGTRVGEREIAGRAREGGSQVGSTPGRVQGGMAQRVWRVPGKAGEGWG